MKNELLTIANIFGWSANNIQLNEQLDYHTNLLKEDNRKLANNRLFLSNYSTASAIMRYFVDLMHEASPLLDTNKSFIIANTDTHIAHKDFKDMANYWNRIKNRLADDNAFLIKFESAFYDYQLFELA
jgi:hypothetical protein